LDYPKSVSTTWLISFEDIRNRSQDAIQLLTLFAFLNPDDILVEFVQAGKEGLDEHLRSLIADPCVFDELLALLSNFSLIQCFKQKKNIAMHRLVQTVVKNGLNPAEKIQWRNKTLKFSSAAFPPVRQKDISLHRRFRSQIMACITDPDMEDSVLMGDLLSRTGWYLDCEGQFGDSQPLFERAIKIYREVEGEDSRDLMINMDRLGWNYMRQGRMTEAANMYQEAFSRMCRILGKDHDDTLACQRNYGVALLKEGKYDQGIIVLEQACAKQRSILGDDNPRTHSTMRKVAAAYMQEGKLDDAIDLLEIVYSSSKSDPRGTFNAVQRDLGWAYCQRNRLSEGISLLENAFRLQANSLGEENVDTLQSARYLACAYVLQGHLIRGTNLLERTCESQERQLGLEHEDTLLTMRYLVSVYESQRLQMTTRVFALGETLKKRGLKPIGLTL
jgi:tetratricopeptide (TPR) repeat protein